MDTLVLFILGGGLLWACWHWFLREWLEKIGFLGTLRGKLAAHQIPDEAYFEQASREIRNGNLREGLWAKAWSDAGGDKTKAQAIYIRLRVSAMKSEAARRFGEASADADVSGATSQEKTVAACPKCGTGLRMPCGKLLDVRCTKCGYEFRVDTRNGNRIEEFPSTSEQVIGRIGRVSFLWLWFGGAIVGVIMTIMVKEGGLSEPTFQPFNFSLGLFVALAVFNIIVLIARLRDAEKSSWWSLIGLIPFVFLILVFYLLVVPGSPGRNRYGPADTGLFIQN